MKNNITLTLIISVIIVIGIILGISLKNKSKQIEFIYKTNGGVPFEWQYEIEDTNIVKFTKTYEIENQNKNGKVGAPIKTKYVFEGLKEGETTITFRYVSLTNETISKEEIHKIKVDKNKNITLIKDV